MIMILRYAALTFDEDVTFDWEHAYRGEFATAEEATVAAKAAMTSRSDDAWQVIDLMTKKVVDFGNFRDARYERKNPQV